MSTEAVRNAIAASLVTSMSSRQPGLLLAFENTKFTQPKGTAWVYVSILPGDTKRADIGSTQRYHTCGVVNCQIFVPEDTGTQLLRQIGDSITASLIDRQIQIAGQGSCTFYGVERKNRGTMNGWYSHTVACEYRAWIIDLD